MEDPCLKCLVRVTCTDECDKKQNYATLLSQGLKNFRGHAFDPRYRSQYQNLSDKSVKHVARRSLMTTRKRQRGNV